MEAVELAYVTIALRLLRHSIATEAVLTGCASVILMFGGLFLQLPMIALAARVVPGFEASGLRGPVLAFICIYVVVGLFAITTATVKRLRA